MRNELSTIWYHDFYSDLYDELKGQASVPVESMTIDQENRAHVSMIFTDGTVVDIYTLNIRTIDGWEIPSSSVFVDGDELFSVDGHSESKTQPTLHAMDVAERLSQYI